MGGRATRNGQTEWHVGLRARCSHHFCQPLFPCLLRALPALPQAATTSACSFLALPFHHDSTFHLLL